MHLLLSARCLSHAAFHCRSLTDKKLLEFHARKQKSGERTRRMLWLPLPVFLAVALFARNWEDGLFLLVLGALLFLFGRAAVTANRKLEQLSAAEINTRQRGRKQSVS